jgi:hypothetical protein
MQKERLECLHQADVVVLIILESEDRSTVASDQSLTHSFKYDVLTTARPTLPMGVDTGGTIASPRSVLALSSRRGPPGIS